MLYVFFPFRTCIASIASGIGLPPRIRTPSISKAKAYLPVTVVSGGVPGVDIGVEKSSSPCLANSMAAAVSCDSLGAIRCFGGTTTVGRRTFKESLVAVVELRRRNVRLFGGSRIGPADIFGGIRRVTVQDVRMEKKLCLVDEQRRRC